MNTEVKVEVLSVERLFNESEFSLAIDTYQRGFVWGEEKVGQLVNDLREYSTQQNTPPYYMGTILLHRQEEKQKFFIIDGQQRILSLIHI